MLPLYEEIHQPLEIRHRNSIHLPPHLHKSLECVYVTEGSLAIGVGTELYEMNPGDFAIVFPELIHHYQVFGSETSKAIYLYADSCFFSTYNAILQQKSPKFPVISKDQVDEDITYALNSLLRSDHDNSDPILQQAFVNIILSRSLPQFELVEKNTIGSNDIIYQTVSYIAANFREEISLTKMANDLGFSAYSLSRVFSGTFHKNFNQYVNEIRLEYASSLLRYTDQNITDVYMNSGFESQRTFNRVFQEKYHMSPREYRKTRMNQNPGDDAKHHAAIV